MKLIDLFSSRHKRLVDGVFKLHEVLQCSPLRDRYWICGGALLGWAREGSLLKHDPDIDFHFWEEDREHFLKGSEMLKQSGFKPEFCWRNTDNHITEYVLSYRHIRFEFFEATKANGNTRWMAYGSNARRGIDGVQLLCETPGQELSEFEFLGKNWLKPKDHVKYLTALYGDWKTPNPDYSYIRDVRQLSRGHQCQGKRYGLRRTPAVNSFRFRIDFNSEIWHCIAEATNIHELMVTTRDISDYEELMQYRLNIVKQRH